MSVTVVIPTYNRKKTLGQALGSLMYQTRAPAEIILVDDGSTDGTAFGVRKEYPQIKILEQENKGVSAARNAGIREANTDWIAFLDSDDVWMAEKLERQMNALEKSPDHRVCHTEEKWVFRGKHRPVAAPYIKQGGWIFERCLPVCAISPSTVLIHKSVFEEVGLFDESLPACEDYDLWLRICSRMPVLLVKEALIEKHGGHSDQLSAQWGLDQWRIQTLQKSLEEGYLTDEQLTLAERQLKRKCLIYAQGLEKHGNSEQAEEYKAIAAKL